MAPPINILLVDDHERNLDTLEVVLRNPAYALLRATDADKALRALMHHDVAVIVLDIQMPGVNGFELAKLIKGTKKTREIPILFLTAFLLDETDVLEGYEVGAVDYMTKPFNPNILRRKIAAFADLFLKTRALSELNSSLELRVQQRTAELARSEAALRAAAEEKDKFLATLAHELRNPLAPVRTGLDLLLQQPDQSAMTTRTLTAMNRQLDHMVRLVDDLLDVARISRGTLDLQKERVDMAAVVERAVELAKPQLERSRLAATVSGASPGIAYVDATRVAQVIANLLNNAAKHSGAATNVEVELTSDAETITVRVIDHGVGIPADQLARLFEMFVKIDRAVPRKNDGLGIGLALSRQIAQLHGGSLTVDSAGEGTGATFTLTLPRGVNGAAVSSVASAPTNTASSPAMRVLLIEDNEDSAELMATLLSELGHEVRIARTGKEGLAAVVAQRPDIVLCDVGLPEMDGVEVCRKVLRAVNHPPVMVALTGWGMERDRERTAEAGFHHHLVKPVAIEQLQAILRAVPRAQ